MTHPFRTAVEANDFEALVATLSPDVVLHSPVTFSPLIGREAVVDLGPTGSPTTATSAKV